MNTFKITTIAIILALSACAGQTKSITSREILFGFDSDRIKGTTQKLLDTSIMELRELKKRSVVIEGHTDSAGTSTYNLDLGDKRARSVKAYFVQNGIPEERVVVVSFGESQASQANHRESRRAKITDLSE